MKFFGQISFVPLLSAVSVWFLGVTVLAAQSQVSVVLTLADVTPGADLLFEQYRSDDFSSVAVVAHAGSVLQNGEHLIDQMKAQNWPITFVYAPEHGFRSKADAGAHISDGKDEKTGLPVKSLYGKNRRPDVQDIQGLDAIIFDLQDVGVRFYTYLSTLKFVLEAAAQEGIPVIVLDRPNPNGFYVDGPILDTTFQSFVGALAVPIVHGMTLGEMAQMIVGENWIAEAEHLDLTIISCKGYTHNNTFVPSVPPSPNLPTLRSILLYPHICYFEATSCSVGRGTEQPFEVIAHPQWNSYDFSIVPVSSAGASSPKHQDKRCFGINLNTISIASLLERDEINWSWLVEAGKEFDTIEEWINRPEFLNLLMGTDNWDLLMNPQGIQEWRKSYAQELHAFKEKRSQYLLYD